MHCYAVILLIMAVLTVSPGVALSLDDSPEPFGLLRSDASCTDRCHVASPLYENEFEGEVFRHTTHSPLQQLGCDDCHDKSDVKDERHGKLLIIKEDCMTCHHVDYREEACAVCHDDIDAEPTNMAYKEEPFLHGFGVDSGVDCGMCHRPDPESTMVDEINCDNCHHTTPDITCDKCHEEDLGKSFVGSPSQMEELGWTAQFLHSQHNGESQDPGETGPETVQNCLVCHPSAPYTAKGVDEYDVNCTGCHHKDTEITEVTETTEATEATEINKGCDKCHKGVSEFFSGNEDMKYNGLVPTPDMMSMTLKCEDCHKFKAGYFLDVRDRCVECHNPVYGELLDAQTDAISGGSSEIARKLIQMYISGGGGGGGGGGAGASASGIDRDDVYKKTFYGIELLSLYGIHNFSYAAKILSSMEDSMEDSMKDTLRNHGH